MRKLTCIILCLSLLCTLPLAAWATELEETEAPAERNLAIDSLEDFLALAEDCRLDTYSQGLTVSLECDLDLSETEFSGIPTFGGTLEGNGHTISGLTLEGDGSVQGLFRYLQEAAVVRNLTVEGTLDPSGSRSMIGGIAGSNAGLIENCKFIGSVSGAENVGGIVGSNELNGIIDACRAEGEVHGSHLVGGIAGGNLGVIRDCANAAQINVTPEQNSVKISDITLDTLTDTESAATVTDIGGIAGQSSGVIRNCENRGNVGYKHMGYNIGGIAGTQSGYIVDCVNYGEVCGRKEVGGIVGQLEPATKLQYEEDALQMLQDQLDALSSLTNRAASNAQRNASDIAGQISTIETQMDNAKEAVNQLMPDKEEPSMPDLDSLQAAQNTLSTSLTTATSALNKIQKSTQDLASSLNKDLQAISSQMNAMYATLGMASENLGTTVTDASDADTAEDLTAKVASSSNYGPVQGDINVGGVVGAVAFENDLDPEDDVEIFGDSSLNAACEIRAVVLDCVNGAEVSVKKQSAGGIVGWMSLGLVKNCGNTGPVNAEDADYVGGIAGKSSGYIRASSAKCAVEGAAYVGGIAGLGKTVSDCRSMVTVAGDEKTGAVLGYAEAITASEAEEQPITGNYYLPLAGDPGAIDGISYDGCAQSMDQEAFQALEDLPALFDQVTVRFVSDSGVVKAVSLVTGGELKTVQIPAVPEKEGFNGVWEGLEEADTSAVYFDVTFQAAYTIENSTIQSGTLRESGLPLLLVQGSFNGAQEAQVRELTAYPEAETAVIEAWELSLPKNGTATKLRYALPDGYEAEDVVLKVRAAEGTWRDTEFTADGSYLVFAIAEGDDAICLLSAPEDDTLPLIIGAAGLVVLIAAVILIMSKRKKRKN